MRTAIIISILLCTGCAHISIPLAGGTCPMAHSIKGNAESGLYHTLDSPYYESTHAEVCFSDKQSARKMGYRAASF